MALFDILKRKKRKFAPKPKLAQKPPAPIKPKKILGLAAKVLKEPQVTEKATDLTGRNQYVFKVWPRSNKTEVKKAVEELYGVNVLNVNIINIPAKQKRLGRIKGWRGGYKKAVVKIKEGQKIEVLPR
mgnify:CR=1 FL=1